MDSEETQLRRIESGKIEPPLDLAHAATVHIPGVELGAQLGRGGMAVVYEARDYGFNPPRTVAVKLMDPSLSSDGEFRARFEREASIVATFRHDNIVHVYSSGEVRAVRYIVMEHLPGGTLSTRLQTGPILSSEALHIACDLASALAYSHAHGIIHRDFKPGNVLFTADGKPVLSDFGVAKMTSTDQAQLTKHAYLIGAPRYMAPEQELAEEVTDRADIFSFGLTLFEMLIGHPPPASVRVQRGDARDQSVQALLAGQPPAVIELIQECLQLEAKLRPSADECRQRLRLLTSAVPDSARFQRIDGAPQRNVTPAHAAMLLGALLLIGSGAYWLWSTNTPEPPSLATTGHITFVREPGFATLYVGDTQIVGDSTDLPPGNHTLVAMAPNYRGEARQITVASGQAIISISLRPATLPPAQELDRFLTLADAPVVSLSDIETVKEPALREPLRMKLMRQEREIAALANLEQQLNRLQQLGDNRASVALLLNNGIRHGELRGSLLTQQVVAASERGDALASFFVAVAQRSDLSATDRSDATATEGFRDYCRAMQLVASQGWEEVASTYLKRDGC